MGGATAGTLDDAALAEYLGVLDTEGRAPSSAAMAVAAVRFRAKLDGTADPIGPAAERAYKGFRRNGRAAGKRQRSTSTPSARSPGSARTHGTARSCSSCSRRACAAPKPPRSNGAMSTRLDTRRAPDHRPVQQDESGRSTGCAAGEERCGSRATWPSAPTMPSRARVCSASTVSPSAAGSASRLAVPDTALRSTVRESATRHPQGRPRPRNRGR